MRRSIPFRVFALALPAVFFLCPALSARAAAAETSPDDLAVWKSFVAVLKADAVTSERIRPYYENLRPAIQGYLKDMREKAAWEEWEKKPEIHRVGDHVHFLLPLTFDGNTAEYCFSFLIENQKWFFRHLEAITIRLDKTASLPTSSFPDVDEATKAHIREEWAWTRNIYLFNLLSELKGGPFAFDFFKDGQGYFLAAKTWVPFIEPRKAFILYACWEEANLKGNTVTLEKLEEGEAVVRMSTYYFYLYKATAHFSRQISFEDYKRIFETIWRDRAAAAGWSLEIEYDDRDYPGGECLLRFKKPAATG